MEKIAPSDQRSGLGPRPAAAGSPPLSRARQDVLRIVAEQPEPSTLAHLAAVSGLHENTVRGHLDGLAEAGLVSRVRAEPDGRGRPAWLWSARPVPHADGYAGLATVLARTLAERGAHAREDAVEAGRSWGRTLATARRDGAAAGSTAGRAREVVALLDELGFAPQGDPGADWLRLTRCPLLEVARELPEIVCSVHLGLVDGALEASDAGTTDTELRAFAEPGACLLRLGTRS